MTARKILDSWGKRGRRDYVRLVREVARGVWIVRVLWKDERSQRRVETFEDSRNGLREAKAFADAKHEALRSPAAVEFEPLSIRGMFEKYVTAKTDAWRGRTLELERQRWRKFELFADRETPAAAIRPEHLDSLKRTMMERQHAPNQVRLVLACVKRVFSWAMARDLIPATKVATYRAEFSKDSKLAAPKMAEYRGDEREQLLAAMDPRSFRQWRAWALTTLIGYCGPRQKAARYLTWSDVDLEAGTVRWRPENDKLGRGRTQPLPAPVIDALWVAYGWRLHDLYSGAFVFYAAQDRSRKQLKPWTYQAYNQALRDAEKRAGIDHVKWRAAHGFRRGIAGDVHAQTGSEKRAAEWIGDKDIRVVKDSYLLERDDELRKTADLVGMLPNATTEQPAIEKGSETSSEPSESSLTGEPAVGIEPTTARRHR